MRNDNIRVWMQHFVGAYVNIMFSAQSSIRINSSAMHNCTYDAPAQNVLRSVAAVRAQLILHIIQKFSRASNKKNKNEKKIIHCKCTIDAYKVIVQEK